MGNIVIERQRDNTFKVTFPDLTSTVIELVDITGTDSAAKAMIRAQKEWKRILNDRIQSTNTGSTIQSSIQDWCDNCDAEITLYYRHAIITGENEWHVHNGECAHCGRYNLVEVPTRI